MYFCVFSYNRGQLLKNCVDSIEQCVDNPKILVFDDNSHDDVTLQVLKEIEKKHQVIKPEQDNFHMHKCGGLYNNMQMSLNHIPQGELAYFVQDDSQIVRKIASQDIKDINTFFTHKPKAAFLHMTFLKEKMKKRDQGSTYFDESSQSYLRHGTKQSAGIYFSAIAIAHIDRLKNANWSFESREKLNNLKAKTLFGQMGFLKNPFLMHLPSAPAYRGKTKTLGLLLAEKKNQCGFHPFSMMSEKEVSHLINRDVSVFPIAENYLTLKHQELPKPWAINPFQGTKLYKNLHKAELTIRNFFK